MKTRISQRALGLSRPFLLAAMAIALPGLVASQAVAQGVVPGSGQRIDGAGDDFEDESWEFYHNWPKSSYNIDKQIREPVGYSKNGRWSESRKRGEPDILKRVPTPEGGLPGSTGALRMHSLYTGIPGSPSRTSQQDDLLLNSTTGSIPVSWSPSIVVRVYLPPFDQWEAATGTHFGLRASVTGMGPNMSDDPPTKKKKRWFKKEPARKIDQFYPGIFIQFNSKNDPQNEEDSAVFIIRGDDYMRDVPGPQITQAGWWTLGMSFTSDGRVHYYASPGVDNLTAKDHIGSYFPQSVHCHHFNTMFFNICNSDTGRTWSTEFIIDDPSIYYVR